MYNFSPASIDDMVFFGAERPGYPSKTVGLPEVQAWIQFMKEQGISRILCLASLPELQKYYSIDLLGEYRKSFGNQHVKHWPIPVADVPMIDEFLRGGAFPFLEDSRLDDQKTVVHCSSGKGRTGLVLAAWNIHRGMSFDEATYQVEAAGKGSDAVRELFQAGYTRVQEILEELDQRSNG